MNSEMEEGKEDLPNNVLPGIITMDILSRLPTKSLLRFRCVSKSWKTLVICNHLFVNMHLNRSKERSILVVRDDTELYSLEYKEESDRGDWLVATKLQPLIDWFKIVGSCNGLLCTMAEAYYSSYNVYPIYIWNPSTRDYKQVPSSSSNYRDWQYGPGNRNYCDWQHGFGYSQKVNDYKIITVESVLPHSLPLCYDSEVYVYSLRYDSWRKLPNISYIIWDGKSGELVNDCLHWIAISEKNGYQRNLCHPLVIAFDIGDETFCEVPLLPDITTTDNCKIHVTAFEMQLCMINIDDREDAKVWVMKEYGVKESWTMLFNIHQPGVKKFGLNLNLLGLTKKGSVLLQVKGDNKNVFSYDPKTRSQSNLQIEGLLGMTEARTYMESTVGVSINNWH